MEETAIHIIREYKSWNDDQSRRSNVALPNSLLVVSKNGLPCGCPTGYEGIHCEFQSGQVPNCTLPCHNNGKCVVGIISPNQAQNSYSFVENEYDHFTTCVCPDNFEGIYCEIEI